MMRFLVDLFTWVIIFGGAMKSPPARKESLQVENWLHLELRKYNCPECGGEFYSYLKGKNRWDSFKCFRKRKIQD